jgi:hypothetical protein
MTQREIIGKTPKISKLAIALAIAGLMIIGGFVVLASSQPTTTSPPASAAATSQSILPDPTLNTNVTWSTFYNGWNPLEYNTGSENETLNTGFSQTQANPISINPLDTQNSQLFNTSSGYSNISRWTTTPAGTFGSALTAHNAQSTTIDGHKAVIFQTNGTSTGKTSWTPYYSIPFSAYPSNNIAYDYLTIIANISTSFTGSGQLMFITVGNSTLDETGASVPINITNNMVVTNINNLLYPNTQIMFSTPLSALTGLNWNSSKSNGLTVRINMGIPQIQTSSYETATVDSIQMTENPYYLGTAQQNGTQQLLTDFAGNAKLSQFNPDFTWTSINNNGYTVATSQSLQNTTISQAAINSNGYSEQVTYQGIETLPSAPDLAYSGTTISMPMNVSGTQYTIGTLNGISYLSAIQAKSNGTFVFGTVNPNNQNSIILQLDYTTSQWHSVSGAPPFFSLAGLEYYWWVGLIGFFSLIGLGSAALAHWGGAEENLRAPKGKFGR